MKATDGENARSRIWFALVVVGLALLLTVVVLILNEAPKGPLAEVAVDDGRIIVVEAVTYGTNHVVGNASLLVERLGPWMPKRLRDFLSPKVPRTSITTGPDTLVVWLNALDANSRTNVDCQRLLVEFEDESGDLWGQKTSNWHAFDHNLFIRIGHSFAAYPRSAKELTLRITPWRSTNTVTVRLRNPRVTRPETWTGQPAPLNRLTNGLEIVLEKLHARTNGAPDEHWVTRSRYWEPSWKLLSDGAEIHGWRPPEWIAADPLGNQGQFLGLHQPVLRYSVTFHPEVTNELATKVVTALAPVSLAAGATNTLWFQTNSLHGTEVVAIGLMTTSMNFFTEGVYEPVAPVPIGSPQGGASTGWISSGRRLSPVKHVTYRGHYADRPVIYLQCRDAAFARNLGVRLRDDQGRLWPTTRESQGNPDGILPFMLDVPPEVTNVTPEIVLLNPVAAEFVVQTPAAPTP